MRSTIQIACNSVEDSKEMRVVMAVKFGVTALTADYGF